MKQINNQVRQFTVVGVLAMIFGYLFLIYQSYNLNNDITQKKNEIQQLESLRIEKVQELTEVENKLLEITLTSKDTNTVKEGEILAKKIGLLKTKSFKITSKQESNLIDAKKFESSGFESLLNKDINASIDFFIKSENSYNGFNTVYEIAKYLVKNKTTLSDKNSEFWPITYKTILAKYSWKMPKNYKIEFQNRIK